MHYRKWSRRDERLSSWNTPESGDRGEDVIKSEKHEWNLLPRAWLAYRAFAAPSCWREVSATASSKWNTSMLRKWQERQANLIDRRYAALFDMLIRILSFRYYVINKTVSSLEASSVFASAIRRAVTIKSFLTVFEALTSADAEFIFMPFRRLRVSFLAATFRLARRAFRFSSPWELFI